jgi:hypothetical protein
MRYNNLRRLISRWFSLAAAGDKKKEAAERDKLALTRTAAQLAEGKWASNGSRSDELGRQGFRDA